MSDSENQDDSFLIKLIKILITPILIALIAGGTSPWWWSEIFGKDESNPGGECKVIVSDPDPPTNVRATPNGKTVLGTLENGVELKIKENQSEWLKIDYQGKNGYVFKALTEEQCA